MALGVEEHWEKETRRISAKDLFDEYTSSWNRGVPRVSVFDDPKHGGSHERRQKESKPMVTEIRGKGLNSKATVFPWSMTKKGTDPKNGFGGKPWKQKRSWNRSGWPSA